MNDSQIDIETEDAPEMAYRRSDDYEFPAGTKLQPFSFLRKTTAVRMGLRVWKLAPEELYTVRNPNADRILELEAQRVGADAFDIEKIEEELESLGSIEADIYDNMMMDVAIVLWLCSLPDAEVRKVRRNPLKYEEELDTWAEENKIYQEGLKSSKLALRTFMAIVNDVNASQGIPNGDGEETVTVEERGN